MIKKKAKVKNAQNVGSQDYVGRVSEYSVRVAFRKVEGKYVGLDGNSSMQEEAEARGLDPL